MIPPSVPSRARAGLAVGVPVSGRPGVGGSYWTTYFPAAVVLGLGIAIVVAPLTTAVMNAVEARHAGVASGINNAVARTAGLLAVALLGIIVVASFSHSLDRRLDALAVSPTVRRAIEGQHSRLAGIVMPSDVDAATREQFKRAVVVPFVGSFRVVMLIGAGLAVCSAVSAAILVEGKTTRAETETEQETEQEKEVARQPTHAS